MDLHTIHHQKIICSLYWGEGRLMEENIDGCLNWQPLQEVPANLWLDPDLFNHALWEQYRPDEQQPLLVRVKRDDGIQTIWLREYDVKAYVRGWKNTPVFRIKKIQFDLQNIAEKSRFTYKKAEAWFVIPGSLVSSSEDKEDTLQDSFKMPVLYKKIDVENILMDDVLEDCHVQLYDAALDDTPVILVKLSEVKSLQGNLSSMYSTQFKIVYDIIYKLLALLSQQNLQPVWQLMKRKGRQKNTCFELVYYNNGAPRRNNFSNKKLVNINFNLSMLYKTVVNKPLPAFMDCLGDLDSYIEILATSDILARFEKATILLNQLIGWRGSDTSTWPQKLKAALNDYHIYNQSRFIEVDILLDGNNYKKRWHNIKPSLHSLKVLCEQNSPRAAWFNGQKINHRNKTVMQLLAELIIGKHLNLSDALPDGL